MIIQDLTKKEIINPPKFVYDSTQYLVMTGSIAYGCAIEDSDFDLQGFCIPSRETVFPHLAGEIEGFGTKETRFETWQKHHVFDKQTKRNYDFAIYSIVYFFHLAMQCNPNIIGLLFVPIRCIMHMTQIAQIIRENRKIFLNKGAWFRYKGYAFSQMAKIHSKNPEGKRKELIDKFGFDVKYGMHVVRLLNEIEQIMGEGDLDLERNREQLKSIRRGDWTKEQVQEYFSSKERELETLYQNSKLPNRPDEDKIKTLLLNCLEEYYGSLSKVIQKPDSFNSLFNDLQTLVEKYQEVTINEKI